jgi:CubicO group peptidase (beta-lactamase class C family)
MSSLPNVKKNVNTGEIAGYCDPRFKVVAEEFERNFRERGEVGASVCIKLAGETFVDLWGGSADPSSNKPWVEDTITHVWSCTKGATALCAHMLIERGLLDLEAPVVHYWPEFGQAGKESIQVKMLLNHQAGLAAISEPIPPGGLYDWEYMVKALEKQEPFWKPGSMHGYHGFTFGWLVGEVIRRVSGKSLGTFFREEVAKPLGLDFWMGLPETHENRVAPIIPADPPDPSGPVSPMMMAIAIDQTSMQALQLFNTGGYMMPGPDGVFGFNTRAAHTAEFGSVGSITNARGLAGMYAPLANGGNLQGVSLVNRESLARMVAVSSASSIDQTVLLPTRFSLGFVKSGDNRRAPNCTENDSLIISEEAFGHPGFGGALGFAEPVANMSFGYAMNRMGQGIGLNARGQSLVDATYLSLGYTSNTGGSWIKE